MNTFTLVITEEHLNRAIEALKADSNEWNKKCILAQAAMDMFPNFVSCGYTSITVRTEEYKNEHFTAHPGNYNDNPLYKIVKDFDKASVFTDSAYKVDENNIETVRAQLPLKVEFKLDFIFNNRAF